MVMLFTPTNHSSTEKLHALDELPIMDKDIIRARLQAQDTVEPRGQPFRRRLPFIVLFSSCGTALFLLAGLMLAPSYSAKAQLIVDPQARAVTDLSTEAAASHVAEMTSVSAALAIETHIGVLNSRDFLQHAVGDLMGDASQQPMRQKPDTATKRDPSPATGLSKIYQRLVLWIDALTKTQKSDAPSLDELEKQVKVAQEGKSDIISITFSSPDPAQTAAVVNRIAETYVDARTETLQASTKREIARVSAHIAVVKNEVGRADASAQYLLQRQPEAPGDNSTQGRQFSYQRLRELTSESAAARLLQPSLQRRLGLLQSELSNIRPDVRVLALAKTPRKPSSLNPIVLAIPVFVSLIMAGTWAASRLERLDKRLRSEADLYNCLGAPCTALLPKLPKKWFLRNQDYKSPLGPELGPYAQAVRFLFASLHPEARADRSKKTAKVIMVASSLPEEGKSTLCQSLSAFTASLGMKTLLVDFDRRTPERVAPLASSPSILESIERMSSMNADYLRIGRSCGDLLRLLTSEEWANGFDELRRRYDFILLDCPPLLGVSDFRSITPLADKVIFAVKWESTRWDQAKSAFRMLRSSGAPEEILAVYTQVDLARQALYSRGALSDYFLNQRRYWASDAKLINKPGTKEPMALASEQPNPEASDAGCETAKA
jgi:polysaccharide biosynthesis transport protein